MGLVRRTAALWGPAVFAGTTIAAARLQPGYSHRAHHISGLAAAGQRSAVVMVPGFLALGCSTLMMPVPPGPITRLARIAGVGVLAAGIIPASQPRCPQPVIDPEATITDSGHGVASVAAFAAWTALPYLAAAHAGPPWYRGLNRFLRLTTTAGFVGAAATTQLDSSVKGLVQRGFLASVFTWYAATAVRCADRAR